MKIRLYQINRERDKDNMFLNPFSPMTPPDPEIYDEVFRGNVDCNDLEDVFALFNTYPPALHRGRAISVSDIVLTDENGKMTAHFCDCIGFKKVAFDYEKAHLDNNLMRVIYAEPGREAYETFVGSDLESMQKAVGNGFIEPVWLEDDICLIDNDSAKLMGLPGNRHIGDGTSVVAGPFFICADDGENFTGLSDSQAERYLNMFKEPEEIDEEEVQADMRYMVYEM